MTSAAFRKLVLSLDSVVESSHMNHPDFRVNGKIFATLDSPAKGWAMVKLSPEQQAAFLQSDPDALKPASGAWGKQGCTHLNLKKIDLALAHELVTLAHERLLASLPQTKRSTSKAKADSIQATDRESKAKSVTRKVASATKKPNASKQIKKPKQQRVKSDFDPRFALIFAQVDQLCLGFPDAMKTITWGEPHYRIKNKIFAGCGVEHEKPVLGCKLTKDHQAELLDRPGISKAKYVGNHGWISIDLSVVTNWEWITDLVDESYRLIAKCKN